MSSWIDISVPLGPSTVHWPGDRPFEGRRELEMSAGAVCNLSSFSASSHAGTHMDAPLHFIAGGASMDEVPFDAVIGPARVIAMEHPERIDKQELERAGIQAGERILFKTANSSRIWHDRPFNERFVAIPENSANYLAQLRPALVGIDYLSVGVYEGDGPQTHRALLGAGIWVLEGLNLHAVEPGNYDLMCLPLRVAGAEGAPARALLRRLNPAAGRPA